MPRLFVRDDEGELWFYEGGRIRMLACDEGDPENGYFASDWEDAILKLNEMGYITEEGKDG